VSVSNECAASSNSFLFEIYASARVMLSRASVVSVECCIEQYVKSDFANEVLWECLMCRREERERNKMWCGRDATARCLGGWVRVGGTA
jgi:ubiquitin C-terminal hydrolase